METIRLNLKHQTDHSYNLFIGSSHFVEVLSAELERIAPTQIALVTDSKIMEIYGDFLAKIFVNTPITYAVFPEGEANKNWESIQSLFSILAENRFDRKSLLIAFGGGVTGDMTGFLASIYMRGIPFIQVPTTLLSMVDSSIGGKTGIDTPKGKNLMGAFNQPQSVIIDTDFLKTLPLLHLSNGMAEVIKHGAIADENYFNFISENRKDIFALSDEVLKSLITKSCRIKASVVEKDEKESGLRQILNFGHTIGHAIEKASDYQIPHGFAVGLGMIAEAFISMKRKILSVNDLDWLSQTIASFELTGLGKTLSPIGTEKIISAASLDKKNVHGTIQCVLLQKIGAVWVENQKYTTSVSVEEIRDSLSYLTQWFDSSGDE